MTEIAKKSYSNTINKFDPTSYIRKMYYIWSGPPGKAALLYSSGWPELRWPDGTVTVLDSPVGEPTIKPTRLYTILVVRFADGDNTRDKVVINTTPVVHISSYLTYVFTKKRLN